MSDTTVYDSFATIAKVQIELDSTVSDSYLHDYLEQAGVCVEHVRSMMIKGARERLCQSTK